MRMLVVALLAAMVAAPSYGFELTGPLAQGGLVIGQAAPGSAVQLDGRDVSVDARSGLFVLGFGRDAGGSAKLVVVAPDGVRETRTLEIAAREWHIERIDGLPHAKVTPDPVAVARIKREGALIRAARARDGAETWFAKGFIWPVVGRISGRYGSQRILNGEPRSPHLGVDIAAPKGTPVKAAAPGRVTLAENDLFYTGGTVVIDHGQGVTTIYSHMSEVLAAVGDQVAQGAVIGLVGATGRVTGPHLDWRVNWFQTRLDAALIAGPMPGE